MFEDLEAELPRVYRFALRLTGSSHAAEDLTQETMLKAWKNRRQLRDFRVARIWLFRIASNLWTDQCRRHGKTANSQESVFACEPCEVTSVERSEIAKEHLQLTLDALNSLPQRQRSVLYLQACEGLSIHEIAGILSIQPSAVKSSLSVARNKVRRQLEETVFSGRNRS